MPTSNKYEDMSALTALKYAKNKNLLLPDIQREYCWDINEIERLFESIVDDYPIGACIFWKANRKIINNDKPNLYYFLREFEKGKSKNEKAPEIIEEENDYFIVLDGQQRITSLNIALYGSYTYYKGGRGHAWDNPKSWCTKELYYNLNYYEDSENDDEHPKKRFCFLTENEAESGNYYKIKLMLAYDTLAEFLEYMIENQFRKECKADLSILFERLHDSSGNGLIHYYSISENTYDEALDIFVRVNSTGRKLSKSDLLFSTLIDGWKDGKENIENIIAVMNSKGDGFQFTRDYLMRLCLVLVDENTNLKINSLNKNAISKIKDEWNNISSSLDKMSTVLSDIGISDENLTSYNATMPLVYYLFKGGEIKDQESKKETKKFLSVSLAKRLFGVASNDALNSTRNSLKGIDCRRTKFSLNLFKDVILTGGRTFTVSEDDIEYWLNNYEKGPNTYILLSLLYPNLKLSQVSFHQDHCHPYAGFDTKLLKEMLQDENKIKDWLKKRNLLPNLQFLEGTENESKNKTPLIKWVEEGNTFEYRPQNISLDLSNFDEFFNKRKELMKEQFIHIFEISNLKKNTSELED